MRERKRSVGEPERGAEKKLWNKKRLDKQKCVIVLTMKWY